MCDSKYRERQPRRRDKLTICLSLTPSFSLLVFKEWLQQHCTCPVCRYELPTEDDAFERGRKERMRNRRPRYAKHELERLNIRELKKMLPANSRYRPLDRDDLINYLISTGVVDLIASPEPVCYSLSTLRQMKASRLKKCMNEEAGVFFDPKDVVEKEDLIEIFINSGRLDVLPEYVRDGAMTEDNSYSMSNSISNFEQSDSVAPLGGLCVETVNEGTEQQEDLRVDTTILMEESQSPVSQRNLNGAPEEMSLEESATQNAEVHEGREQSEGSYEVEHGDNLFTSPNSDSSSGILPETNDLLSSDQPVVDEEPFSASASENSTGGTSSSTNRSSSSQSTISGKKRHLSPRSNSTPSSQYDEMSISELRRTGHQLSIGLSDCLERSEMIERLENATRQQERNAAEASSSILPYLTDLTTSDLRLLICVVGSITAPVIGGEREELVHQLAAEVQARPYAKGLIEALIPFLSLSVSQLRSVARSRGIDLSDCIEKAEMLRRLTRGSSH